VPWTENSAIPSAIHSPSRVCVVQQESHMFI